MRARGKVARQARVGGAKTQPRNRANPALSTKDPRGTRRDHGKGHAKRGQKEAKTERKATKAKQQKGAKGL